MQGGKSLPVAGLRPLKLTLKKICVYKFFLTFGFSAAVVGDQRAYVPNTDQKVPSDLSSPLQQTLHPEH